MINGLLVDEERRARDDEGEDGRDGEDKPARGLCDESRLNTARRFPLFTSRDPPCFQGIGY